MSEYTPRKTEVIESSEDLVMLAPGDIVAATIDGRDEGTMMVSQDSGKDTLVLIKTYGSGMIFVAKGRLQDIKVENGKLVFSRQQSRFVEAYKGGQDGQDYGRYWAELIMAGRENSK